MAQALGLSFIAHYPDSSQKIEEKCRSWFLSATPPGTNRFRYPWIADRIYGELL